MRWRSRSTRALAIREKVLGPDHPDVATSAGQSRSPLSQPGSACAGAATPDKRALAIYERALGPDHPDVAISLNNLASLHADQGHYATAEPLLARSSAILEKALGPNHPDVSTSLANLAELRAKGSRHGAGIRSVAAQVAVVVAGRTWPRAWSSSSYFPDVSTSTWLALAAHRLSVRLAPVTVVGYLVMAAVQYNSSCKLLERGCHDTCRVARFRFAVPCPTLAEFASQLQGALRQEASQFIGTMGSSTSPWHLQETANGPWVIAVTTVETRTKPHHATRTRRRASMFVVQRAGILALTGVDPKRQPTQPTDREIFPWSAHPAAQPQSDEASRWASRPARGKTDPCASHPLRCASHRSALRADSGPFVAALSRAQNRSNERQFTVRSLSQKCRPRFTLHCNMKKFSPQALQC